MLKGPLAGTQEPVSLTAVRPLKMMGRKTTVLSKR